MVPYFENTNITWRYIFFFSFFFGGSQTNWYIHTGFTWMQSKFVWNPTFVNLAKQIPPIPPGDCEEGGGVIFREGRASLSSSTDCNGLWFYLPRWTLSKRGRKDKTESDPSDHWWLFRSFLGLKDLIYLNNPQLCLLQLNWARDDKEAHILEDHHKDAIKYYTEYKLNTYPKAQYT